MTRRKEITIDGPAPGPYAAADAKRIRAKAKLEGWRYLRTERNPYDTRAPIRLVFEVPED